MPVKKIPLLDLWNMLVAMILLAAAIDIPLKISIKFAVSPLTLILQAVIFLILASDIFVQYKKSNDGTYGKFARTYAKQLMLVDILAALPIDLIGFLFFRSNPEVLLILNWIRVIRLIKLIRILMLANIWQHNHPTQSIIFRLVLFGCFSALISHWIACGWLIIGESQNSGSNISPYLQSLYWTVTTLTTVGYGDITPVTTIGTVYTMFVMVLGVGFYGYVIGNAASLLANLDAAKAEHNKHLEQVNSFIKYRHIPEDLQNRMHQYYKYMWESGLAHSESSVLDSLPFTLKTDVSLFLNKDIIENTPIFKEASEEMIRELVNQLEPVLATPGDFVIRKGDSADSMYFISHGEVDVVEEDGKTLIVTLKEGQFFGEMSLLTGEPRNATIRSREYCNMYTLDKKHFNIVLDKYPNFKDKINKIVEERNRP